MTDVSTCPDCGLPLAPDRKTRGARVDLLLCGARFSTHYELHCKRVAVTRLRSDLATLQARYDTLVAAHAFSIAPGEELTELEAAERAVVEAAVHRFQSTDEGGSAWVDACMALVAAIDALLAARAKAGR